MEYMEFYSHSVVFCSGQLGNKPRITLLQGLPAYQTLDPPFLGSVLDMPCLNLGLVFFLSKDYTGHVIRGSKDSVLLYKSSFGTENNGTLCFNAAYPKFSLQRIHPSAF